MKLAKTTQEQTTVPHKHESFYPRVINNTNINFSDTGTSLLDDSKLTYTPKGKLGIVNRTVEVETSIT